MAETYARVYSSLIWSLIKPEEEAIWRLGASAPPSFGYHTLFDYAVGQYVRGAHGTQVIADKDCTNQPIPNRVDHSGSGFRADTWIARVNRIVDDQLLSFLGTVSVSLLDQSSGRIAAETTLVDLLERCPLKSGVLRNFKAECRSTDGEAAMQYSIHARTKSPSPLKIWIYLEGVLNEEVR